MQKINGKTIYFFWTLIYLSITSYILNQRLYLLDSDLGWHLKFGQDLFTKKSFPYLDQYSYTYLLKPWVNHSWLADLTNFWIFDRLGYFFLVLAYTLIFTLSIYLAIKITERFFRVENQVVLFLVALFTIFNILPYIGVRDQVISLLGLVLVIYILLCHDKYGNGKILFTLPFLFFIWVNLHGGFIIGLAALLFYLVFLKKNRKIVALIFILSIIATFINPYGLKIWDFIFQTITNTYGKTSINEWLPIFYYPLSLINIIYWAIAINICYIIFTYKRQLYFTNYSFYYYFIIFLVVSSTLYRRNIPLLALAFLPIFVKEMEFIFKPIINKIKSLLSLCYKLRPVAITLALFILLSILSTIYNLFDLNIKNRIFDSTQTQIDYPQKAIQYLNSTNLQGNIFNQYAWGGYLIWQAPQIKVFIDGRMCFWQDDDGNDFLITYDKIISTKDGWQDLMKKYNINLVLLPKDIKLEWDWFNELFFTKSVNQKLVEYKKNYLVNVLKDDPNWQTIFEDDLSIILKKEKND